MTPTARAAYPPANRLTPAEWHDPDDTDPLRRSPRTVKGQRRYSVIDALHKRTPREVTAEMVAAAKRLVEDVEASACGFTVVANYAQAGAKTPAGSRVPADQTLDAMRRVRAAGQALGCLGDVVAAVVGGNVTVKAWAARQPARLSEAVAKGWLLAALTLLVEHYERADGK